MPERSARAQCQSAVPERSASLEVSCSFLAHLSSSPVFAVNKTFDIQNFVPFQESGVANEGAKKISGQAVASLPP